jgi:signal transduction histidine kinase
MTTLQQRALNDERSRISRDIHDNLGSRLTEMILLSDLARRDTDKAHALEMHVGRLSNIAREVVRDLDAIVWAVNPKNDFLDNLASYIFRYVEKFLGMTSIRFRVDVAEEMPHRPLSSEARHSLFLVVKEALNNIVKHSGATEVWVRARTEHGDLTFAIEDNGKGFSHRNGCEFGNGLSNMEKRVSEIGGRFALESEAGKGTRIKISVPLHRGHRRVHRPSIDIA